MRKSLSCKVLFSGILLTIFIACTAYASTAYEARLQSHCLRQTLLLTSRMEKAVEELERLLKDYQTSPDTHKEAELQRVLNRYSSNIVKEIEACRLKLLKERMAIRELNRLKSLMNTPMAQKYLMEKYNRMLSKYRFGTVLKEIPRLKVFTNFLDQEAKILKNNTILRQKRCKLGSQLGNNLTDNTELITKFLNTFNIFREALSRFSEITQKIDKVVLEKDVLGRELGNSADILKKAVENRRVEE